MGVICNIYCVPPRGVVCMGMAMVLRALADAHLIAGPLVHGPAYTSDVSERLISPEVAAGWHAMEHLTRTFADATEALGELGPDAAGLLAMMTPAREVRCEPSFFSSEPASLGIYRVPSGHRLVAGAAEDYADVAEEFPELAAEANRPPRFDQTVQNWVWIHGKNAPLLGDFIGSPLYDALNGVWPGATFVADEWP